MTTSLPQRASRGVAASIIAAFCAFAITACDDGGDDPPATPTAVATSADASPQPTATPTPSPPDRELADRLHYEGDLAGAIGAYGSVAADSDDPDTRSDALFAQAQLLMREQRFDEARVALDAQIAEANDPDPTLARYMLASTLDDLGDMQGALDNYQRYIDAGGTLAPFANIEKAKLLARLGRIPEADALARQLLTDPATQPFHASFALSMGAAMAQGGNDSAAIDWYNRVEAFGGDLASARARIGGIHQRLGDPAWIDDYAFVVAAYPGSAVAPELVAELDAVAAPVSAYDRGFILYRNGQNAEARLALEAAVAAGDRPALALYYLGALDERADDDASAIVHYQQSYDTDPGSPLAPDALWWRGRLLEAEERWDEALLTYTALAQPFDRGEAGNSYVADANFRRALMLYRKGDHTGAGFAWGAIATTTDDEFERARATYWQGVAERAAGNGDATLERLAQDMPEDFYGLRAEAMLGNNETDRDDVDLEAEEPDWDEIESFFRGEFAATDDQIGIAVEDPRYAVARDLDAVGLHAQANAMYSQMLADYRDEPVALYPFVRRLHDDGNSAMAAQAADALVRDIDERARTAPDELYRIAYPIAFGDLVEDAAEEFDVDPLLLLALMRQESFYDPQAGSVAGALGLTQVIEPTGESIAASLGINDFTVDDLFGPRLSLRFGASYLADQMAAFEGDPYHALAAYNGGPGAPNDALGFSGDDVDLFVESLEFEETRNYVRLVLEHYARYRHLYEGLDQPSLPE